MRATNLLFLYKTWEILRGGLPLAVQCKSSFYTAAQYQLFSFDLKSNLKRSSGRLLDLKNVARIPKSIQLERTKLKLAKKELRDGQSRRRMHECNE